MKSSQNSKLIFMIVGVLVIGGGLFFGGYQVGKSTGGRSGRQFGGPNGLAGGTRGDSSSSFVSGEVIAKDDTSVTVKLADGGSQIIFLSDSTQITKSATGVADDLSAGTNISANGSKNTDGSISAKTVQIRPAGMMEPGQVPPTSTSTQ